jgi:hypothetical protein
MIILITFIHEDERTGRKELLVSHGVDIDTLRDVCLPQVPPSSIGRFQTDMGEWVYEEAGDYSRRRSDT